MKPEIRYVGLRDRPSVHYLQTGQILWTRRELTLEEFQRMYLTSGHENYWQNNAFGGGVYVYDPTDDGPECETITRILAKHPFYKLGQEKHDIAYSSLLSRTAWVLYNQIYDKLSQDEREDLIKRVAQGFVVRGQA